MKEEGWPTYQDGRIIWHIGRRRHLWLFVLSYFNVLDIAPSKDNEAIFLL